MDKKTIEQIAFNIIILEKDIPKVDKIASLMEIGVLAQLNKESLSYFVESSLQTLEEEGYEDWKEVFSSFMIASDKLELIIELNKIF